MQQRMKRVSNHSASDLSDPQRITAYTGSPSASCCPDGADTSAHMGQNARALEGSMQPADAAIQKQPPAWRTVGTVASAALLNVPTLMVFVALFVGLIPPIKRVFFLEDPERQPPLDVISRTLSRLSAAAIPSMMVALGGSLSRGPGAKVPWLLAGKLVRHPAGDLACAGRSLRLSACVL